MSAVSQNLIRMMMLSRVPPVPRAFTSAAVLAPVSRCTPKHLNLLPLSHFVLRMIGKLKESSALHYMTVVLTVYEKISPFGCLTMARRCLNPVVFMQLAALAALIVCLVSARERSLLPVLPDHQDLDLSCPYECDCKGLTVDCSDRGLRSVPHNIPSQAKRV